MFSPHGRLLSPQVFRRGITVSLSTKRWHRPRSNRRPMDGPESKLYHAEALAQTALVGALHAAGFELLVSARVKDRTNRGTESARKVRVDIGMDASPRRQLEVCGFGTQQCELARLELDAHAHRWAQFVIEHRPSQHNGRRLFVPADARRSREDCDCIPYDVETFGRADHWDEWCPDVLHAPSDLD
ncbi:hypothetical protein ABIB80_005022 [Bradyrhizobium sp. i1.15.2]|uniref:hypothetical protein n=1 Tax=Bradyrhizobium sp. i1.15.2 TaxID=3156362 RepID=UPI00339971CD